MANIFLVGVAPEAARQILRALVQHGHQIRQQPPEVHIRELRDADIVFAGGEPRYYLTLFRRLREVQPALPFVVVTQIPETKEWLDALEAGVTDYCSVPIERRQLLWLIESAMSRLQPVPKMPLKASSAA
jgi:DNA-binding response OmpR family regulator